jgi:predicted phage-related endonuclease
MLASVDGRVVGERRIIEVKRMDDRELWDPGVPLPLRVQMQHALEVTGADVADVVAFVGANLRIAEVPRDDELIEEIVALEAAFWRAVEARRWPPAGTRSRWANSRDRQSPAGRRPRTGRPTYRLRFIR